MSWQSVPVPERMQSLPRDRAGRLVPAFVATVNGEPDHRVVKPNAINDCIRWDTCWLCDGGLPAHRAFLIGPMCVINRVAAEPPMHKECAAYAAQVCPFLTTPARGRRETNMPADAQAPAGIQIKRNPGVVALWTTTRPGYSLELVDGGVLHRLSGDPTEVLWYSQGRAATRAEVKASIHSGLPALRGLAREEGPFAQLALTRALDTARKWYPEDGSYDPFEPFRKRTR